ncbi:MAG: putative Ig domain-containing protein [Microcoleaceae cyanobacterium]
MKQIKRIFPCLMIWLLSITIFLVNPSPGYAQNLVRDGGFENLTPYYSNWLQGDPSNSSVPPGKVELAYPQSTGVNPYEGQKYVTFTTGPQQGALITENLNTQPGQTYQLKFAYVGFPDTSLHILWNNQYVDGLPGSTGGNWRYQSYTVTATQTITPLTFNNCRESFASFPCTGTPVYLDAVSVEPFTSPPIIQPPTSQAIRALKTRLPDQKFPANVNFFYQTFPPGNEMFSSRDIARFEITGLPAGVTQTDFPLGFTGRVTNPGTYPVYLTAIDRQGNRASIPFNIIIEGQTTTGPTYPGPTPSGNSIPSTNPCGKMIDQGVAQIGQNMNVMTAGQPSQVRYNQPITQGYPVSVVDPNTMSIDELTEYGNGFTQTYSTPSWIRLQQTGSTFSVSGTPPLSDQGKCYIMTVRWRTGGRTYGDSTFGFYVASKITPGPTTQANRIPAVRQFPRSLTVKEGESFTNYLANVFTDPDGDRLTLRVFKAGTVPEDSQPVPNWMTFNPATGELRGTPPPGTANQVFAVSLQADDGKVKVSTGFELTVISGNRPPTVNPSSISETATEGISFSKDLSTFFSDRDGDRLNYQLSGSYPSWLNLNSSTGVLSGVPNSSAAGRTFNFTVIANDGKGGKANLTVSIVVKSGNRAPKASKIGPETTTEEVPLSPGIDVSKAFTDPDGDTLTYTVTGTFPSGLRFDSATNKIVGTPASGAETSSPYTLTITATDPDGLSASTTLEIQVKKNQPPRLKPGKSLPATIEQGQPISDIKLSDLFEDPDRKGSTLKFKVSKTKLPSGICVKNDVIKGCPDNDGTLTIPVKVTDVDGNTHTETWNLTIQPGTVNNCPTTPVC